MREPLSWLGLASAVFAGSLLAGVTLLALINYGTVAVLEELSAEFEAESQDAIERANRSAANRRVQAAQRAAEQNERDARARMETETGRDLARRCSEFRAVEAQLPGQYTTAKAQADAACSAYDEYLSNGRTPRR